jgi:hypothetical protein
MFRVNALEKSRRFCVSALHRRAAGRYEVQRGTTRYHISQKKTQAAFGPVN